MTFVATERAYFFVMSDRRQVDIMKCRTFQPPILDPNHYSSYMWIKGYQGYFLLRQLFHEQHAGEWRVIREIEPETDSFDFFDLYGDQLEAEMAAR